MSSSFTFAIVAKSDNPIYCVAKKGGADRTSFSCMRCVLRFASSHAPRHAGTALLILRPASPVSAGLPRPSQALDIVDEELWKTNNMFLKVCPTPSLPALYSRCFAMPPPHRASAVPF